MVRNILDLRSNNWIPRREEVNSSTLTKFFSFLSFWGVCAGGEVGMENFLNYISTVILEASMRKINTMLLECKGTLQ